MTTRTPTQARSIWKDTRAIVYSANTRAPRSAQAEQPKPETKSQAEKEADRWVAQMMFENYNP